MYTCVCVESDVVVGRVDPNELVPRRVGEAIGSTVGTLATLVNYPIGSAVVIIISPHNSLAVQVHSQARWGTLE